MIDNNKLDLGLITKENGELYLKMENQQGDHMLVVADSSSGFTNIVNQILFSWK